MEKVQILKKSFWAGICLIVIVLGCEDAEVDPNSPSQLIKKSEDIELEPSVSLPSNEPNGNERVATYFAKGYQIYRAQQVAGSNPATYEWVFVAPIADLYDKNNKKVGS